MNEKNATPEKEAALKAIRDEFRGTKTWLERLECPSERLPELGIGGDLTSRSIADLWGLYRLMAQLADGGT
jgi:hypothetical protein